MLDIASIVITGGDKFFAAGADISQMATQNFNDVRKFSHFVESLGLITADISKPIIAAVCGYALGGGCEVALMCDVVIAGESAKFGLPEVKIGTIPGAGGTQRLVRAVGKSKAMEMVLTGNPITAQEAERAGLVSRVVPDDKALETALQIAEQISQLSKPIISTAKECVNRSFESSLQEGVLFERRAFQSTFAFSDRKEGMDAFLNKRKPKFTDQ